MNTQTIEQLQKAHKKAKKKLVLGIVFSGIAYLLSTIGFFVLIGAGVPGFFILGMLFWCVGLPFLIVGIVKTIKAKRQLSIAKREAAAAAAPVEEVTPVVEAPAAETPVEETPVEEAPAEEIPAEEVPTEEVPKEEAPEEPTSNTASDDFDWRKYNPLDAGVSMNMNKDYKFHRAEGFAGSAPQKFINRTFLKCPICCSKDPYWTISQHNQMSWKGNLYLFKCSRCESVISMSMPDVTTLSNGAGGIASNPTVGLTNLMVKGSSGKEVGAVYAVIETVGNSGFDKACEGKEFKLEDLQDMLLR